MDDVQQNIQTKYQRLQGQGPNDKACYNFIHPRKFVESTKHDVKIQYKKDCYC
jgi:hypothetical protein